VDLSKGKDTNRTQGLRRQMVEELKEKGIYHAKVLAAMLKMPRHFFVSSSLLEHAYLDTPLPIDCQQTISHPYTVARQTELLEISKNQRVLEIGTGSGYQAAILKTMETFVYTIERQRILYQNVKKRFEQFGLSIGCKYGDGYKGWKEFAPFDRILITCAVSEIPFPLLEQLTIGGIMVLPVGQQDEQTMTKIVKNSLTDFSCTTHGSYRFVPMLKEVNIR
jgi:protein-L-isoaspartate(D-aspartate) O-methyltransferase